MANEETHGGASNLSPEKRALLERRLRGQAAGAGSDNRIPRRAAGVVVPLSLYQQRLWFLDQLQPGRAAYVISEAHRFPVPIDRVLLERSVNMIVARHESLRTVIGEHDGAPTQLIAPSLWLPLHVVDLRALDREQRAAELEQRVAELAASHPDSVPRPAYWGGYRVVPDMIELWQGQPSRLHDRVRYQRVGAAWRRDRLAP